MVGPVINCKALWGILWIVTLEDLYIALGDSTSLT